VCSMQLDRQYRPGDQVKWLRFLVVSSVFSCKFRDSNSIRPWQFSSKSFRFPLPLSHHHLTARRYVVCATSSVVK
jgi:hypothetical protein